MGKVLVIKGADFSAVKVATVDIDDEPIIPSGYTYVVLTGNEDWQVGSVNSYGYYNFYFFTTRFENAEITNGNGFKDAEINISSLNRNIDFSNETSSQTTANGFGAIKSSNSAFCIRCSSEIASTVIEMKSYLAKIKPYIIYKLATE